NAYVLGSIDHNLLVVEGKPLEKVSLEQAEEALWSELDKLKEEQVSETEITKIKNKTESTLMFTELSILDKAMNLSFYELLGDAASYNQEINKYLKITHDDILRVAKETFTKENSNTLKYRAKMKGDDAE